jgi:hypothetical protein
MQLPVSFVRPLILVYCIVINGTLQPQVASESTINYDAGNERIRWVCRDPVDQNS